MPTRNKKVYFQTFGCQMNVYDTDRMLRLLAADNYVPSDSYESADLVVVNTCAIREKAVQKVYSFVGRICRIKRRRPDLVLAVTGCVAQQQSREIVERFEGVDLVLGTHAVDRMPSYLQDLEAGRSRIVDVAMTTEIDTMDAAAHSNAPAAAVSSFVTIMRGCDNFCTYCVVPYVRGRETSRKPEAIVDEVRSLVAAGTREVTLLGQNVNSYGKKEGLCSFAELLDQVSEVSGLARIRFVTSHPKDLSDELIRAFGRLDKLCNHIHLPVQSGADRVLQKMNRKYTAENYMERVAGLRAVRPDIAISSDFIVGFPGETQADFQQTLDLIDRVGFDSLFAFEYSDRPEAPARRFEGKVAPAEKKRRLQHLLDRQSQITHRIYEGLVGRTQTVLVEGLSKKRRYDALENGEEGVEVSGRSPENRIVNFFCDLRNECHAEALTGRLVSVKIEKACANSLWGKEVAQPGAAASIKGGKINAA
ncbi:MAG: tRNA (N6-isopentenyl adenosine(37)-C2)-methylthiotransferase MiaB [Thermodesulfobacteriota bacterium]